MKKMIALFLALALLAAVLPLAAAETPAPGAKPPKVGMLSFLNITEEKYADLLKARELATALLIQQGYIKMNEPVPEATPAPGGVPPEGKPEDGKEPPEGTPPEGTPPAGMPPEGGPAMMPADGQASTVVFYDNLAEMLLALQAGDIDKIEVYQSVAKYLVENVPGLEYGFEFDLSKEQTVFVSRQAAARLGNGFSFLMMQDRQDLADQFNEAIIAMKEDGTLGKLVAEQIDGASGGNLTGVPIPQIEGAETIRVAVTGDLPPMDYISPDGTAAGFNTAVLAEISRRIGKNIEIVCLDSSIARATALESRSVDVAFWTRKAVSKKQPGSDGEPPFLKDLTEEELKVFRECDAIAEIDLYIEADLPEGTVSTETYFTDVFVPVLVKK